MGVVVVVAVVVVVVAVAVVSVVVVVVVVVVVAVACLLLLRRHCHRSCLAVPFVEPSSMVIRRLDCHDHSSQDNNGPALPLSAQRALPALGPSLTDGPSKRHTM